MASSHPPSRHMNTSPTTIDPVFRDGVVGTPCGHLRMLEPVAAPAPVDIIDSSSNVTIFSRGFCIDIMFVVMGIIVCWTLFGGGGNAKSPTPDKLNSLTLRGTKYSMWLSRMPVDRRAGVFRWKFVLWCRIGRGNELYSLTNNSWGLCQDLTGVIATVTKATSSSCDWLNWSCTANFRSQMISSVCIKLKHMATMAMPIKM